jgi:hypothetical protein
MLCGYLGGIALPIPKRSIPAVTESNERSWSLERYVCCFPVSSCWAFPSRVCLCLWSSLSTRDVLCFWLGVGAIEEPPAGPDNALFMDQPRETALPSSSVDCLELQMCQIFYLNDDKGHLRWCRYVLHKCGCIHVGGVTHLGGGDINLVVDGYRVRGATCPGGPGGRRVVIEGGMV